MKSQLAVDGNSEGGPPRIDPPSSEPGPESLARLRLPGSTHRTLIVGRTGSGKSVGALWLLSRSDFDERPFIIIDTKREKLIAGISRAEQLGVFEDLPDAPGIYVVRPEIDELPELDQLLRRIWDQENCGVWIDEGLEMGQRNMGLRAVLTQGRSKNISVIMLVQRPAWCDKFMISEADFYQVFWLNAKGDRKVVEEFLPIELSVETRPPEYHTLWYDVGRDLLVRLSPVDAPEVSLDRINVRLAAIQDEAVEAPKLIRL